MLPSIFCKSNRSSPYGQGVLWHGLVWQMLHLPLPHTTQLTGSFTMHIGWWDPLFQFSNLHLKKKWKLKSSLCWNKLQSPKSSLHEAGKQPQWCCTLDLCHWLDWTWCHCPCRHTPGSLLFHVMHINLLFPFAQLKTKLWCVHLGKQISGYLLDPSKINVDSRLIWTFSTIFLCLSNFNWEIKQKYASTTQYWCTLIYWEYPRHVHWGIEIISEWKLQHKDKLTPLFWKQRSVTFATVRNSWTYQYTGKWQKPVFQICQFNRFWKVKSAVFKFWLQLSPHKNWLLGRKVTFYGGRVKGEGVYIGKQKKSKVHVAIPHYYLVFTKPNFFFWRIHLRL